MRVLIVEDDRDMNSVISKHLESSGFAVDACYDAEAARHQITNSQYDVVVLDIMLPKGNGLDVVRWMRGQNMSTAVLFLTARDSVEDRIAGLDAGADDYLTKPFSLEELAARIRAMTRRLTENKANIYKIADLELDIQRRSVQRDGREIELSMREFSILEYLMRNAGIVLSREQIERYIWNYDYIGNSNVVEVYISSLRKKIDAASEHKLIHTVRSVGYTIKE